VGIFYSTEDRAKKGEGVKEALHHSSLRYRVARPKNVKKPTVFSTVAKKWTIKITFVNLISFRVTKVFDIYV